MNSVSSKVFCQCRFFDEEAIREALSPQLPELRDSRGHAFGLTDRYDNQLSIMSASVRGMSKEPTDDDARRLAQVLLWEIKGRPLGEINLAGCAGFRAD